MSDDTALVDLFLAYSYQESGVNKLKRAVSKPAVNVVESLRNR